MNRTRISRACARAALVTMLVAASPATAQRPQLGPAVRAFVAVDTPVVALVHARVIDGTGAPARAGQTVVLRDGAIAAMGDDGSVTIPAGARVFDLTGKSVVPGLVMVHEHLFYPTGPGVYGYTATSFLPLYLAGGVTSMRTGGNMNGFGELRLARAARDGQIPGPWVDATAPYVDGDAGLPQKHALNGAAEARRHVDYWADAGATSFKAYMAISRAELGTAIEAAHARGLKVTAHLCSVTAREAAELGIDNIEHGLLGMTDFVDEKAPDACPGQSALFATAAALDVADPRVRSVIDALVGEDVALTSTLPVLEAMVPSAPLPPGLDVLHPSLKESYEQARSAMAAQGSTVIRDLLRKEMAFEVAFVRAGGLLIAGTDPTGAGGVVPGFANQRQVELLVEAGFTPLEAIRIATLNGATYLGIADRVGSLETGKQGDLVVIAGDPSTRIEDIRNVELVFRQGVGYDPATLIDSVRGKAGLY